MHQFEIEFNYLGNSYYASIEISITGPLTLTAYDIRPIIENAQYGVVFTFDKIAGMYKYAINSFHFELNEIIGKSIIEKAVELEIELPGQI
jgi:hypothetical protein